MTGSLLLSLSILFQSGDKPAADLRPDLLVEVEDLDKVLAAKKASQVLDARPKAKYSEGHLAGAVLVDTAGWAKAFADGQSTDVWAKRLAEIGVTRETRVVICDDNQGRDAARIWYILRYWGVKDARLLNGGFPAWKASNGKTTRERPTVAVASSADVEKQPGRLTTKDQLLQLLKSQPPQIVDARSVGEYCGTQETAKRNGAIPGAKHLEWSDTIDKKTGKFKSADDLTKLFKEAGIDPAKPAVTYCQSGGRAAVLAFTLELMGGKDVSNYYRSWAEWGNDPDTPIEKPQKSQP